MKAVLNHSVILSRIPTEEQLLELSRMDTLFAMRKLRACVSLGDQPVELGIANRYGQRYCEKFLIWFDEDEYQKI